MDWKQEQLNMKAVTSSDVSEATTLRGRGRDTWGRGQDPRGRGHFFGLKAKAEFEAKFMRRQRFEKPKNICNGSFVKTRRHVQNVRNWVNYRTKSQKLNNSKCKLNMFGWITLSSIYAIRDANESTNK